MSSPRVYQSIFGIQAGDIVTTDYGTGPYEVVKVIRYNNVPGWGREFAGVHLVLRKDGRGEYYLGEVVCIDSEWYSRAGKDRLTVTRPDGAQLSLFGEDIAP